MKNLALAVAFLLELVAFVAFASFGYLFTSNNTLHITLFVALGSLVIVFWSLFMAPKAPKKLKVTQYYVAKSIIYAVSAVTICGLKGTFLGVLFVVAAAADELLLHKHNTA